MYNTNIYNLCHILLENTPNTKTKFFLTENRRFFGIDDQVTNKPNAFTLNGFRANIFRLFLIKIMLRIFIK